MYPCDWNSIWGLLWNAPTEKCTSSHGTKNREQGSQEMENVKLADIQVPYYSPFLIMSENVYKKGDDCHHPAILTLPSSPRTPPSVSPAPLPSPSSASSLPPSSPSPPLPLPKGPWLDSEWGSYLPMLQEEEISKGESGASQEDQLQARCQNRGRRTVSLPSSGESPAKQLEPRGRKWRHCPQLDDPGTGLATGGMRDSGKRQNPTNTKQHLDFFGEGILRSTSQRRHLK